ncbi:MAG: GGDEF domain-containing protein [Spirochaetes bacterium]|nr:GGDEF domain-containing protein [Spirochaetota bacterium]
MKAVKKPGRPKPGSQPVRADTIEWLGKASIFSSLGGDELRAVASCSERRVYAPGETVYGRDAPGDALFVVVRGSVGISDDGSSLIAELVPGDCFGELELLTAAPRNASAIAETPTELIVFPRKGLGFDEVLAGHPAASARMLYDFLDSIAGRIRNANALIKENSPVVQELKRQVYGDKLTGLFNKTFLEERLAEILKDRAGPSALLMFKPDNFKEINDTWGHEAGDSVLKLVALELSRCLDESDTAFRYMGNELAVTLPGRDRGAARAEAARIMERLVALDISAFTEGSSLKLSFSFGIALHPDHAKDALALIAIAHELPLAGRARGGGIILFPEDRQ